MTQSENGFLGNLISLVLLLIIFPFIQDSYYSGLVFRLLLSFILLFSVYSLIDNQKIFLFACMLAIPTLVTNWGTVLHSQKLILFIDIGSSFIYFSFIIIFFMIHLFRARKVNPNVIYIAISVYLLFGLQGGFLYTLLDLIYPDSFTGGALSDFEQSADLIHTRLTYFIYYSYSTMTTLGYGDIVATKPHAQYLSVMYAVLGQLYLTVLLAKLVSSYVSYKQID